MQIPELVANSIFFEHEPQTQQLLRIWLLNATVEAYLAYAKKWLLPEPA